MLTKSIYFMFFVCIFLWGLVACSSKPKDNFSNLSSDEFERLITEQDVQCLDTRTPAEFTEGHIEGSININVLDESFAGMVDELLDPKKPVAVYCKSGRRSRNAARILQKKGFVVYNLDKGYLNWVDLGKTVIK